MVRTSICEEDTGSPDDCTLSCLDEFVVFQLCDGGITRSDFIDYHCNGITPGGYALSVAALIDSVQGMIWSNAALVPFILIWQVGVAVTAGHRVEHR